MATRIERAAWGTFLVLFFLCTTLSKNNKLQELLGVVLWAVGLRHEAVRYPVVTFASR